MRNPKRALPLAAALLLALPCARAAEPEPWQFALTPYLWLPSVDAQLGFPADSGGSDVEMSDLLKHLSGALFLNAEARKGRWGLSADLVYCDFNKEGSSVTHIQVPGGGSEVPVNTGTTTSLTGYQFSLAGLYRLEPSGPASVDLLAGARYTHIGATLDWSFLAPLPGAPARTGTAETGADLWNGVVGARARLALGATGWYVPLYLDAGAGSSRFTWQALAGAGYPFSWGDVLLVYRYLSFEQGGNPDVQRFSLAGFALGATFRF
ncbi:MAG: hypothetical protein JSR36_13765 [Proteobacteria bacterium]|nr:hypothetical protein [Pseudomonadota bacterium]